MVLLLSACTKRHLHNKSILKLLGGKILSVLGNSR